MSDGDVNNDGSLTPGDALCAFNIFLGGGVVPPDCDVPDWDCEIIAADVNCDGTVTPGDALAIFNRFWVGGDPEECFAQVSSAAAGFKAPAEERDLYDVGIDRVVSLGAGVIEVPVVMDAASGEAAFGFALRYDPEQVRFEGIDVAQAAASWKALDANEVEPGHLIVGGFDPKGLASDATYNRGTVEIATLRFRTLADSYAFEPVEWAEQILRRESGDTPGDRDHRVTRLSLGRPFPNPARDGVTTVVSIPSGETHNVRVAVYDVQGRLVKTLLNEAISAGTHSVTWDRRSAAGHRVSSGIYFVQMKAAGLTGFLETKKVVILK